MDEWGTDLYEIRHSRSWFDVSIFVGAAALAIIMILIFGPDIEKVTKESPIILNLMFGPSFAIGLLYGIKMTDRVMRPSQTRSPVKRAVVKIFLFLFLMGAIFSSVTFALHGGVQPPQKSVLEDGLIPWASEFIEANGGLTFLIVSGITLMAAATKRIVGMEGLLSKVFTFVGTFVFFSMISLSFSHSDPSHSQVYLYAFYQAGIAGGIFYQMNKLTSRANMWEDFANGY
ncbi:MAG: hypothetical protein ACT4N1_02795 [Nitrososphaerota archaeon]